MSRINLLEVDFLPQVLSPGILYVSHEFGVAGHLCPCGCGSKVITPIEPTEWSCSITDGKPTLYPSIGNWQLPCRSHYWIIEGKIEWSYPWSEEQILMGRKLEEKRRVAYYENTKQNKYSVFKRIKDWLQALFC